MRGIKTRNRQCASLLAHPRSDTPGSIRSRNITRRPHQTPGDWAADARHPTSQNGWACPAITTAKRMAIHGRVCYCPLVQADSLLDACLLHAFDKHPSPNFDCVYRIHVHFALARVAALQGYSWADSARVSSHLLISPHVQSRVRYPGLSVPTRAHHRRIYLRRLFDTHLCEVRLTSTNQNQPEGRTGRSSLPGMFDCLVLLGASPAPCTVRHVLPNWTC